MSFQMKSLYSS